MQKPQVNDVTASPSLQQTSYVTSTVIDLPAVDCLSEDRTPFRMEISETIFETALNSDMVVNSDNGSLCIVNPAACPAAGFRQKMPTDRSQSGPFWEFGRSRRVCLI